MQCIASPPTLDIPKDTSSAWFCPCKGSGPSVRNGMFGLLETRPLSRPAFLLVDLSSRGSAGRAGLGSRSLRFPCLPSYKDLDEKLGLLGQCSQQWQAAIRTLRMW